VLVVLRRLLQWYARYVLSYLASALVHSCPFSASASVSTSVSLHISLVLSLSLSVCWCVYVCVCWCLAVCMFLCVCHVYLSLCGMHVHVSVSVHRLCVCVCVCVCVFLCVCIYVWCVLSIWWFRRGSSSLFSSWYRCQGVQLCWHCENQAQVCVCGKNGVFRRGSSSQRDFPHQPEHEEGQYTLSELGSAHDPRSSGDQLEQERNLHTHSAWYGCFDFFFASSSSLFLLFFFSFFFSLSLSFSPALMCLLVALSSFSIPLTCRTTAQIRRSGQRHLSLNLRGWLDEAKSWLLSCRVHRCLHGQLQGVQVRFIWLGFSYLGGSPSGPRTRILLSRLLSSFLSLSLWFSPSGSLERPRLSCVSIYFLSLERSRALSLFPSQFSGLCLGTLPVWRFVALLSTHPRPHALRVCSQEEAASRVLTI
jgi:hypothetical protein